MVHALWRIFLVATEKQLGIFPTDCRILRYHQDTSVLVFICSNILILKKSIAINSMKILTEKPGRI